MLAPELAQPPLPRAVPEPTATWWTAFRGSPERRGEHSNPVAPSAWPRTPPLRARENASALRAAPTATPPTTRTARTVLVLSNARYEAHESLLGLLRAGGLRALSPRGAPDSVFGCSTNYLLAPFAEKRACAKAALFVGSSGSSFSAHTLTRCDDGSRRARERATSGGRIGCERTKR
jgi:hypothetical protein